MAGESVQSGNPPHPFVLAKAGVQVQYCLNMDCRFRGNERVFGIGG
jgi:hypothetical protein